MDSAKRRKVESIFAHVLKTIKPSESETQETIKHSNQIMGLLKDIVDRNVEIQVVGSIARATNLRGSADIDIFMLFDKRLEKDKIVRKGLEYAKLLSKKIKNSRYEVRYAEHPYARLYLNDFNIKLDVVPAYKLTKIEDRGTAVDRTPLHTDFINKNLTEKQRDDVRLLKYLLKTHNIYGAEVKIKGFSGYLCELLVYNFGSLVDTLEFFSKLELPICIRPKERDVSVDPTLQKKFGSEFVVVDPVDPNRNVAAIVSVDALAKLCILSKSFLKNPDRGMFYGSGIDLDNAERSLNKLIASTDSDIYLLKISVEDKVEDIIWSQLNKLSEIIIGKTEKYGFVVTGSAVWINARVGNLLFLTPKVEIRSRLVKGPNVFAGDYAFNFIKSHKNAYGFVLKRGMVYAFEDAEYANVGQIIESVIKERRKIKNDDIKLGTSKIHKKISADDSKDAYVNLMNKIKF